MKCDMPNPARRLRHFKNSWDFILSQKIDEFTEDEYQERIRNIKDEEEKFKIVSSFIGYLEKQIQRKFYKYKRYRLPEDLKEEIMIMAYTKLYGELDELIKKYDPTYAYVDRETGEKRPMPFKSYIKGWLAKYITGWFFDYFEKSVETISIETFVDKETGEVVLYQQEILSTKMIESKITDIIDKIEENPETIKNFPKILKYVIVYFIDRPEIGLEDIEKYAFIIRTGMGEGTINKLTGQPFGEYKEYADVLKELNQTFKTDIKHQSYVKRLVDKTSSKIKRFLTIHRRDIVKLLRDMDFKDFKKLIE